MDEMAAYDDYIQNDDQVKDRVRVWVRDRARVDVRVGRLFTGR